MTIEERIIAQFMEKIARDKSIPRDTLRRIEALWKQGQLKNADAVLDAIRQGASAHGENPTS
jgi:hypothetical protein